MRDNTTAHTTAEYDSNISRTIPFYHTFHEETKTGNAPSFTAQGTQELDFEGGSFDVITAIQCHHYLDAQMREKAVKNCHRMLKNGGIFITFENIAPAFASGLSIGLRRWEHYQISHGKTPDEARQHRNRYGNAYFPISVSQHMQLLHEAGFPTAELLWASYMQAGFYAIK